MSVERAVCRRGADVMVPRYGRLHCTGVMVPTYRLYSAWVRTRRHLGADFMVPGYGRSCVYQFVTPGGLLTLGRIADARGC